MSRHRSLGAALLIASTATSTARAQSDAVLAAARSLFAEALHDEEAGRLAVALEKFRRVRDVRDTAPVEYRIATCEEGLGRLVSAAGSYSSSAALAGETPGNDAVGAAARDRFAGLQHRIGHLTIDATAASADRREILVDGAAVPAMEAIALDPGPHVISARAPGAPPFNREVVMPEGGSLIVPVVLAASPTPSQPPKTAGWIGVGAGAALIAAAGVLLVLRQSDIGTLNAQCPPPSRDCMAGSNRLDLEGTRNRALAEGPAAIGLAAAGAVAAGVGVFLLLRGLRSANAEVAARLDPSGVALLACF